jgi:hypothetical protein
MGVFRDFVAKGIEFAQQEILPLRYDLIKAGILQSSQQTYEKKANLTDPLNYGTMNYGYKEKWSLISYEKLRALAVADPIVSAVIMVRVNQIASFANPQADKYKLGYKVRMRDVEKEPGDGDKKRIKEIESFIQGCGVPENFDDTPEYKRRDNFETFLRKISRDSLTYDQINFEITPRKNGVPYEFQAVDACTIRLIPDKKEMNEYYYGNPGYKLLDFKNVMPAHNYNDSREFKPKHPSYVQVVNGQIRHLFDEWEMAFGVRNPRTDLLANGYGFSELEMLIATITAHMNAETYNRKFFSQGATVKGILTFEGSVPPDQLEMFRRQWYMQSTGVSNSWKTPIMALGKDNKANWIQLHSTNKEMEFGKWMEYCIKSICGVYQIDPLEIGFDITRQGSGERSSGTGGLGHGDHKDRVLYSQEKGLRPLLRHIQYLINDYIVYRIDPNFEFEFVGMNAKSEKDELDQAVTQAKTFKTINEIRAENDMDPIPELDKIKSPADLILDSSWVTAWTSAKAQEQQAMMGGPGMGGTQEGQQGGPGAQQEGGEPEGKGGGKEPDYESMSVDELQQELNKLEGKKGEMGGGEEEAKKSFIKEIEL